MIRGLAGQPGPCWRSSSSRFQFSICSDVACGSRRPAHDEIPRGSTPGRPAQRRPLLVVRAAAALLIAQSVKQTVGHRAGLLRERVGVIAGELADVVSGFPSLLTAFGS